jgi:hypothetical protein
MSFGHFMLAKETEIHAKKQETKKLAISREYLKNSSSQKTSTIQ